MKQKSLKKNAIFNLIKSLMNIIFPIISFPYASRILLPSGIGKVNFANSIIEYFVMFAALGVVSYATREVAKIRDDNHKLNAFSREILLINCISTAISYIALFICFIFVDKFNEYRILIIVTASKILFSTLGIEWLYRAKEEYGYITLRQIIFQIISLILLFSFVKTPDDYVIYAAIGVFANVGSNVLNLIYSRRFINVFEKTKLQLKKHIKPIITFFGITCAGKINNALDAVMLGFLASDTAVGLYSAAIKICRMVFELITSVVSSFLPRTSYYIEKNQMDEYKKIIEKVFGGTFFFAIPSAFGLFFLCEPIIVIFSGDQYLSAIPSMKIMSFSIIFSCANSFLNNLIITPQRKEKFTLISQISAAICNIILNILLIKKYEVLGAAIATLIVEIVLVAVILIPSFKFLKNKNNLFALCKIIIGSVTMFIVLYFTCNTIENHILKIVLSLIIGGITYILCETILKNQTVFIIFGNIKNKISK